MTPTAKVIIGDVLERLRELPSESVHCCVTSPPYWGLRDYGACGCSQQRHASASALEMCRTIVPGASGQSSATDPRCKKDPDPNCNACGGTGRIKGTDGQLGLEPTPAAFIAKMTDVFREVRRVLRKDGTCWVNMGDSYAGGGKGGGGSYTNDGMTNSEGTPRIVPPGLKPKDLCGIPWRLAFALQDDGWVLRQEIIWQKRSPMPESVTDRCTKSHEQIFMLAKATWSGKPPGKFSHITDEDARWLALFLDTEGNICVKRVQRSGRLWYGAQICFAGTCKPLLERAKQIIGCGSLLERAGKNAPMFYLQLSNRQAAELLERIYPHIIVKRRQARIAVYLQSLLRHRGKRGADRFRTEAETSVLESLWMRNKQCNRFGTPDMSDVPDISVGRWSGCERYFYDADAVAEPAVQDEFRPSFRGGAYVGNSTFNNSEGGVSTDTGNIRKPGMMRNLRSVWTLSSEPFSAAHFATFPSELPRRCIKAGTSEKGCCPACLAPYRRVTDKSKLRRERPNELTKRTGENGTGNHCANTVAGVSVQTRGWEPTCQCNAGDPVPCTVLDCFSGSGTTGMAATELGRNYIGLELNPEYAAMSEARIWSWKLRDVEKAPEPLVGQRELFG